MKRVMKDSNGFIKLFYILSMFLLLSVFLLSGFVSADNSVVITTENLSVFREISLFNSSFDPQLGPELVRNTEAFFARNSSYSGPSTDFTIKWRINITGPENSILDPTMVDLDQVGERNPELGFYTSDPDFSDFINNSHYHYPFSVVNGSNRSLIALGYCDSVDLHDNFCGHDYRFFLDANDFFANVDRIKFNSTAPLGLYTIIYELVDNNTGTDIVLGNYSFTVNLTNGIPVANGDSYSTNVDVPLDIPNTTGVLINDTDAENSPLNATLVSNTINGNLTFNSNGSFNYTPNSGFTGEDNFTYIANDGIDNSNIATVIITVTALPVNPPNGNNGGGGGGGGSTTTITCTPNWQCTAWNECNNEKQTRVCTDSNSCGTLNDRPDILQDCTTASSETKSPGEVTNQTTSIKTGVIGRLTGSIIGDFGTGGALIALIFVVVVAAALITSMIVLYRKNRIEYIERDVSRYMGVSDYN